MRFNAPPKKAATKINSPSSTNAPSNSLGDWITYTSDKNDFSAVLPAQPQRDSASNKVAGTDITTNSETYTAGVKGDAYIINVFRYTGTVDFSNPKINLQNLLIAWIAQDKNSVLQSSSFSQIDGHDTLDFYIVNGTENIKGRIVAKDQIIYEIFADYQDQQPAASSFQKFIDGFSFK
ncbi:MAG: hypothetical protein Q7S64_01825 [bacterium]|nr:hypothetical protein [bacterium]